MSTQRPGLSTDEIAYLSDKVGHAFTLTASGLWETCSRCKKRQKAGRKRLWYQPRTEEDLICPKAHKPNRWRVHFRRWQANRNHKAPVIDAAFVLAAIQSCEYAAKHLPQDMRHWAYHPVARKYRRLVRLWWNLPTIPLEVARKSSSYGATMTGATAGEPAYFRAATIARNAIRKVDEAVQMSITFRNRSTDELPALARKAAHAVRKMRPDLFQLEGVA